MNYRKIFRLTAGLLVGAGLVVLTIIVNVQFKHARLIKNNIKDLRTAPVALILGASVKTDGTPSDALRDRVSRGVELWREGKVESLLMSGDDGKFHTNEVSAMRKLALDAGVAEDKVQIDPHGYRTYESCKRAKNVFNLSDVIIVTQRFHLGRALYLCSQFGLSVQGYIADVQAYKDIVRFWLRDLLSCVKAWWDVNIFAPASPVAS